jgi:hypothetical protein
MEAKSMEGSVTGDEKLPLLVRDTAEICSTTAKMLELLDAIDPRVWKQAVRTK